MDIKKMVTVVQCYIGIRKGVDVDISIETPGDILLLSKAYEYAIGWMKDNNVSINRI